MKAVMFWLLQVALEGFGLPIAGSNAEWATGYRHQLERAT